MIKKKCFYPVAEGNPAYPIFLSLWLCGEKIMKKTKEGFYFLISESSL